MKYIVNQDNKYKEFLCGNDKEIFNISLKDVIPGSTAYIPKTTNLFILGPDYEWYNKKTGELYERPLVELGQIGFRIAGVQIYPKGEYDDGELNETFSFYNSPNKENKVLSVVVTNGEYDKEQSISQCILPSNSNAFGGWYCIGGGLSVFCKTEDGKLYSLEEMYENYTESVFYSWEDDKHLTVNEFFKKYDGQMIDIICSIYEEN